MGQESGVGLGDVKVVGLNRNGVENRRDEAFALVTPAPVCQPNADLQLSHSNSRHRDVVGVVERCAQRLVPALGVHQNRRVEYQSRQRSVSGSKRSRSSRNSAAQASSG